MLKQRQIQIQFIGFKAFAVVTLSSIAFCVTEVNQATEIEYQDTILTIMPLLSVAAFLLMHCLTYTIYASTPNSNDSHDDTGRSYINEDYTHSDDSDEESIIRTSEYIIEELAHDNDSMLTTQRLQLWVAQEPLRAASTDSADSTLNTSESQPDGDFPTHEITLDQALLNTSMRQLGTKNNSVRATVTLNNNYICATAALILFDVLAFCVLSTYSITRNKPIVLPFCLVNMLSITPMDEIDRAANAGPT